MNCVLVILLCLRYLPCCNDFVYFYCLLCFCVLVKCFYCAVCFLCFIGFEFTFVFVVFFGFFFSSLLCVLLVFDLLLSIAVPFYSWFVMLNREMKMGKCTEANVLI